MSAILSIQVQVLPKLEQNKTLSERTSIIIQSRMMAFRGKKVSGNETGSVYALPSVLEAVLASIQLQQAFRKEAISDISIGIHTNSSDPGDLDFHPLDLEVLSRILVLGATNTVVMSEPVLEHLKKHPEFQTSKVGKIHNKAYPGGLSVYALNGYGLGKLPGTRFYEKLKARLKFASALLF